MRCDRPDFWWAGASCYSAILTADSLLLLWNRILIMDYGPVFYFLAADKYAHEILAA